MKDNKVLDFGFLLKSLFKNWIIGLITLIIVALSYYIYSSNLKKVYVYEANIAGLDSYQAQVLNRINNKLNNLQNIDYFSFQANNTSAFINMDLENRILMNEYTLERDKYNQTKKMNSRDQLFFLTENFIYSQIINLSRDKSFFKNTIEKYKKENKDKLVLISNIIKSKTLFVPSDEAQVLKVDRNIDKIKVVFKHNSEFDILEDFANFFIQNLNQVILENLINSFNVILFSIEEKINAEILNTNKLNDNIIKSYKSLLSNKILLLKKNIKIAKDMNLAKPIDGFNIDTKFVSFEKYVENINTFLLGYEILEAELEFFESINEFKDISSELKANNSYLIELENFNEVNEFKSFLNSINFSLNEIDNAFKIVNFNPGNAEQTISQIDIKIIRTISIVAFLSIYIFVSLLITILRKN